MQAGISFYYVSRLGRRADDPVYITHKDDQDNTIGHVRVAETNVQILGACRDGGCALRNTQVLRRFGNVIDLLRCVDLLPIAVSNREAASATPSNQTVGRS